MTIAPFLVVNSGMAPSAECEQVFQRVVPQFFGHSYTCAINVVDMQILLGSAVLTSEIIPFQCLPSIAAKVVVVPSFSDVLISLRVLGQRSQSLRDSAIFNASWTVLLGTRRVGELISTFSALQRGANGNGALLLAKATEVLNVLLLPVRRSTAGTALLHRAGRLVEHLTDDALALLEAATSLSMGRQCAWLAPFQCGSRLGHLHTTVGTGQDPVLASLHSMNQALSVL